MMTLADYKILFKNGHPIMPAQMTSCINNFGKSYNATVRNIIQNSEELNEATFKYNAAKLLINFKMVRKGPFHGLKVNDSQEVHDPKGNLKSCWEATKNDNKEIRDIRYIVKEQTLLQRRRKNLGLPPLKIDVIKPAVLRECVT